MVAKFNVVFTASPPRPPGDGPAPRIVLVKEFAGRSPAAVDRHARAWFTAAYPEFRILTLDVHPRDEIHAAPESFPRAAKSM